MSPLRSEIKTLLGQGMSSAEIARRLRVAGPTVDYHVERLARADESQSAPTAGAGAEGTRVQIATRRKVQELLEAGLSRAQVARELGVSKATVSYHARRLGAVVDARCARRYDWNVVQEYYDEGHSARECQVYFGFCSHTWHAAAKRGAIRTRPAKTSNEEYFVAGKYRSRTHVKRRLLAEGLKQSACEECGLTEWRGRPLSLALHHINGDRYDNRVENLAFLCANCHSQTDTFSGRNAHRRRTHEY